MNELQNAAWDNSNIYKNLSDPKISSDLKTLDERTLIFESHHALFSSLISHIENKNTTELYQNLDLIKELYALYIDASLIYYELRTYSSTLISVDSTNEEAKAMLNSLSKIFTNLEMAFTPIRMCVLRSPADFYSQFLNDKRTAELAFPLTRAREQNDYLLSTNEEVLLKGFSLDGLSAWGKLYDNISGSIKVNIDGVEMPLSSANNFYSHTDRTKREKAYRGINAAWQQHEISACAILNSINGWRNENYKVRSTKKELHFLDKACHSANITRETLNTLMTTTFEKREFPREVLKTITKELKLEYLGPWDLFAPYPTNNSVEKISFPAAIEIIVSAFNEVNVEMGAFAQMMMDKNWIDSGVTPNRAQGAYCTGFAIAREPRVFMTYDGSMKKVITLAHEIGHAYHSWVMRDIPVSESMYPMTLAETASIFAETVVRDYLCRNSKSKEDLKQILWNDIESAHGLMINIPARFEFEKKFVELRLQNNVSVKETKELMIACQKMWYGDTLSEYDEMFWASKLHFHMSDRSFYNYPYLFGYLFSLGIYAKKDQLGAEFHSRYVSLLRDTGRMTAEELVLKHFNEDITKPEFWLNSIAIVEKSYERFKEL